MSDHADETATPLADRADAVPGWFVPVFPARGGAHRTIAIRELFRHQWGWLFGLPLLLAAALVAAGFALPPKYEGSVLLAPVDDPTTSGMLDALSGQLRGLASLVGVSAGGQSDLRDRAVAVLKSRNFTTDFIEKNGLAPKLYAERWDAAAGRWRTDEPAPAPHEVVEKFDRGVRFVTEDRRTGFVRVSIRWRDPVLAAEWANAMVAQLNERMRLAAMQETRARLAFLQEEAKRSGTLEVQQAVYRLMEAELKSSMLANVRHDYAFKVIDPATPQALDDPISPRPVLMAAFGFVAGLVLGALVAVQREKRRRRG